MKRLAPLFAAGIALVIAGCVLRTEHQINAHITVDIRHIKEEASDILDFIEGNADEFPAVNAQSDNSFLQRTWEFLSPVQVAYAAEEPSAVAKELATKMRERRPKVDELKKKGHVGEDNRGYLAIRPSADLDEPGKKNAVQEVIAAENADRKALYAELARAKNDPKITLTTMEKVFAQTYLLRAKTGEHFQLPESGPNYDEFVKSPVGKKVGDLAKPGAWVVIP
jgi:uncharacterized protein YdbL (DUF1318 family)